MLVLIAKKTFKKNGKRATWIDFKKYHELVSSGKEFKAEDYLKTNPSSVLSGENTIINEKTEELAFYGS